MELTGKIRSFIESNLTVFEDESDFNDDDDIFELGYVNSLFALQLILYIEQEFCFEIDNSDLNIKNFSSIKKIVEFVETAKAGRVK